jgi:hypothetical protein
MLFHRWMRNGVNGLTAREPSLIKLYMELTGTNESRARSVLMFVCYREGDDTLPSECDVDVVQCEEPTRNDSRVGTFGDASNFLKEAVAIPA